ncbi:crotonase/enoyl-CoA hydratase family protein [Lentisalinibacter salinarum]|uniref:crotonase/enoyl-CoA hydratase family protein n=1 Tax=Lentisalinibacter salinarum TaxID=2992239 RepID=UPI00386A6052
MSEPVLREVADGVMTITLNRPERLNAFNPAMRDALIEAYAEAGRNDDVRVVILTGAGRAFCAGADLESGGDTFNRADRSAEAHRDGGGRVTLAMFDCPKPIIAAINGPAVGVGLTMTLPADIRLTVPDNKLGFVFLARGIAPDACSSWFLPRIVGVSKAMEWFATARVFGTDEAREAGLVSEVLDPDALLPRARALAAEIAENTGAVSVALARALVWRMLGAGGPHEAHLLESRAIWHMGQSADAAEGVTSFLEKRKPQFPLRVSEDMPPFYPWWQDEH